MKPKKLPKEEFDYIYSKVPRLCVEVIIQTDQGVILTKREITPYKGMWHFPGGTIFKGEKTEDAVKRVALDELGIKVKIKRFLGIVEYLAMDDGKHCVGIAYLIDKFSGKLRGSYQGQEFNFFKKLPPELITEQKRFLTEHLGMK